MVGQTLKSRLPAQVLQRLERKPPGPPPSAKGRADQPDLWEGLGLRPRTG
jgi:hypothetical protein